MGDVMKTIKNYAYKSFYQLFLIIVPFITIPYVSRILGAELIGINSYTNTIISYFVLIANLGILIYGNRTIAYHRESIEERSKKFWEIVSIKLLVAIVAYVIFIIFLFFYSKYSWVFVIQSVQIIATAFDISWLFDGVEDFKRTVVRNFLVKIISIILIFTFVKSTEDFDKYIWITVGSTLMGNLTLWSYLHHYIIKIPIKSLKLSEHLVPILTLFIPQIASIVFMSINKILLGNISTISQAGYFENADKVIRILLALVSSIGVVVFPKVAHAYRSGDMKRVLGLTYMTFDAVNIITIPIVVGIVTISPTFSSIFFGTEFQGIDKVLSVLVLELIFMGYTSVLGSQYLIVTGQTYFLSISVFLGIFSTVISSFFFIPIYGALGSAISSVIGEASIMIGEIYLLRNQVDFYYLYRDVPKYMIASAVMYISISSLNYFISSPFVSLLSSIAMGAVTYVTVVLLLCPRIVIKLLNKNTRFF